jgi:hypothetical protein
LSICQRTAHSVLPLKKTKDRIKLVGEEFDAKTVEHLAAIIDVLKELSSYFTAETNDMLKNNDQQSDINRRRK